MRKFRYNILLTFLMGRGRAPGSGSGCVRSNVHTDIALQCVTIKESRSSVLVKKRYIQLCTGVGDWLLSRGAESQLESLGGLCVDCLGW